MSETEELSALIRERIRLTELVQELTGDPEGLCAAAIAADERFLRTVAQ